MSSRNIDLIPAIKAAVAVQRGDAAYANVRPPFGASDASPQARLRLAIAEAVQRAGSQA